MEFCKLYDMKVHKSIFDLVSHEPICQICKYKNECPINYNRLTQKFYEMYNEDIPVEK